MRETSSLLSGDFLDSLTKLGGAIVGLSLFAYIAGYAKVFAMYSTIQGSWIIEFLSAQDILRVGCHCLAMVGLVVICAAYIFYSRGWVWLKIFSFWVASSIVSFFSFAPKSGWDADWFDTYDAVSFVCALLFVSSGCLLASSGFLYISKGFTRSVALLMLVGGLISLYVIPTYLGKSWGHNVLLGKAALPKVVGSEKDCFLLGSVNSKYLIGCFFEHRTSSIKIVDVDKDVTLSGL